MEEKPTGKKLRTAVILCSVFFVLVIFNHNIDVYFNGINYILWTISMLAIFLTMAVFFVKSIKRSIKKRKQSDFKPHLPTIIYTITFILCSVIPGSESFESASVLVAGYEGAAQGQSIIKFRKNKTFEMNTTAVFGYNEWFTGTYIQKGDTLLLAYETKKPRNIGNKLLETDKELITIDKPKDSTIRYTPLRIYKIKK